MHLRDQQQAASAPAFLPVVTPQSNAVEQIIIELRDGRVLRLPMQMPVAQVTELVRALEAAL